VRALGSAKSTSYLLVPVAVRDIDGVCNVVAIAATRARSVLGLPPHMCGGEWLLFRHGTVMCVRECVCVIYIYIYMYICLCIYICILKHTHMYMYMHIHICTHRFAYT